MAYAQFTGCDGLRGIEESLAFNKEYLNHMGFLCKAVPRTTLADANENRSWKIWAEFGIELITRAQKLYAGEKLAIDLDAKLFALDSTTIDLCLTSFPWAEYKTTKSAVKMHTLLNLRGQIPSFIVISKGVMADVKIMDEINWIAGAYYVMDRGYIDYERLYRIHQCRAFFVTRTKTNLRFSVVESRPVDKTTGLRCDQIVRLKVASSRKAYPEYLRRINYYDQDKNKYIDFMTNDFELPALTITEIFKQRWQIELFFKWIKQNLKIKEFYGYNENAVRTQLWIAIAVYCLLAIIRKELGGDRELSKIQQILGVSIFQKIPINGAFLREDTKNDPTIDQSDLFYQEL
jgi:hypothetical protein